MEKSNFKKIRFVKIKSKGFSLVELLIVITIIGVLSTIILSSVSNSRARAYDSKVKQQLASFRTAAEVYFSNQNPNGYGPATSVCTEGIFNDMDQNNGSPALLIAEGNLPNNTQVRCGSTDTAYAVKASLYSGIEYWCVDSKGSARVIQGEIGSSVTFCP